MWAHDFQREGVSVGIAGAINAADGFTVVVSDVAAKDSVFGFALRSGVRCGSLALDAPLTEPDHRGEVAGVAAGRLGR